MPELPEVEVVRAGLEPAVRGALITGVEVFDTRSLKRHDAVRGPFDDLLVGRRITAAVRRGKFLWFPLAVPDPVEGAHHPVPDPIEGPHHPVPDPVEGPHHPVPDPVEGAQPTHALVAHLGMSGQVLLRAAGAPDDALLRIRMTLEHPEHGEIQLAFVDQRIFGSMAVDALVDGGDDVPAGYGSDSPLIPTQVSHIARDPLDPSFDERAFFAALARRNTGIKRALLDQTLVSGIGNIYADEALWAARIHFDQPTNALSRPRARTLLTEVRLVLGRALAEGGTSFDAQYVNVNGASGYFSHSLNAYGQHGKACPRCGSPIERVAFMNRSSHFCPRCQRIRASRAVPVRPR
ncbi:bifunctional DNA-formamidopyrimidine glycosylase/DNA-(apurinic or apyrimidinic site) lyase [Planctomonas psychrotolerans]|uniref:bifunctional DNA-formamidopyrimidine glycosylase/DNA-(apurinic or apyrimidinic site) lyase n=1 Tax=Planctomonas psychrotolerans TaxID=2528712 RepID=UPI001239BEC0|nr:bifunctional DNA-formamidopyrimidine glycosylase/DNA-(apurinic or apyrimidinic site) lyase [Planctomonas psychrotolerans]